MAFGEGCRLHHNVGFMYFPTAVTDYKLTENTGSRRRALHVEEKNRSWCSSSAANDQRAITIECASDATESYAFKDVVYNKLIELCVDICKRNGKNKLLWFGDKTKTLNYIKQAVKERNWGVVLDKVILLRSIIL